MDERPLAQHSALYHLYTFVADGRLQVNVHRARHVLAGTGLGEESVERVVAAANLPIGKKQDNPACRSTEGGKRIGRKRHGLKPDPRTHTKRSPRTHRLVARHLAIWLNTVLEAVQLPKGCA